MRPANSLSFRLVVSAGLWSFAALLAGGVVLSFVFQSAVERNFDARLTVLMESLIGAADISPRVGLRVDGPLGEPRFDQPYSGWYWQVQPQGGEILRSRSLWDTSLSPQAEAAALASVTGETSGPEDQSLRLLERDITLPGAQEPIRFMVAADTRETAQEVAAFNQVLFYAFGVLGVGLVLALVIQVQFGLRPLRSLRRALTAVREGRQDKLEGEFPSEIAPLVDEMNALIAHNAEVVERARTHVGNLAHALKTPISVLSNASEKVETPLAQTVQQQLGAMRRHVDHHLSRARAAGAGKVIGARTDLYEVAQDLLRTLGRIYADKDLRFDNTLPSPFYFRGERQDAEEVIGNLLDNACKWGLQRISISGQQSSGRLTLTIEDDGPGLPPEALETAFARGGRVDEQVPGSGLGLAIARDIAGLYGGAINLSKSGDLGGLRADVSLPAAS